MTHPIGWVFGAVRAEDGLVLNLAIDASSPVPPFEQLRSGIAGLVTTGALPAGSRLPTVRQLAADFGLAANTVARAYRELEADGVIETHGRRGTFVSSSLVSNGGLEKEAAAFVQAARRLGYTVQEATRVVEQAWTS
jgi:DNA-binding transcriptional regulator YhcF (GntR family)